jgi:uncharacterized membrane protein
MSQSEPPSSSDNKMKPEENSGDEAKQPLKSSARVQRLFFTGLLVVVPIWGTYLILSALLVTMEGVLGNLMKSGGLYYVPGLGILVLVVLILVAGLFTTNIFGKKVFGLWEKLLDQVPLVRNIYSMVKSVVDTVSMQTGEKKNFSRVVVLEYPRKDLFTYVFVVGERKSTIDRIAPIGENVLSVFVPTVPNPISGFIILVPESDVIPVTVTVEEAMKIVFSIGLHSPDLKIDESRRPQMNGISHDVSEDISVAGDA